MNSVQYLTNSQGVKTSVVISMEDWMNLSRYIEEVKALEEVVKSVQEGLAQAKKMEQGELPVNDSTEDFLNAL
jgi:exonuclease VII small subunit